MVFSDPRRTSNNANPIGGNPRANSKAALIARHARDLGSPRAGRRDCFASSGAVAVVWWPIVRPLRTTCESWLDEPSGFHNGSEAEGSQGQGCHPSRSRSDTLRGAGDGSRQPLVCGSGVHPRARFVGAVVRTEVWTVSPHQDRHIAPPPLRFHSSPAPDYPPPHYVLRVVWRRRFRGQWRPGEARSRTGSEAYE